MTQSFARHCLLIGLCLFHLLLPAPLRAAPDPYLGELKEKARALDLSGQRAWHVLLHYKKPLTGSYRSRITDDRFFLAPDGKVNPAAELEATLAGFFAPQYVDGEHPQCRFPARLAWLAKELGIDPARLPAAVCSENDEVIRTVDARSAVMVFPVGHINNPASMFGHTLVRIDSKAKSNLISYAANYAADATDSNGLLYAVKGLTGGYQGYYSLLPYYLKVKEYGDLEHRDMWEYRLKLSKEEVDRMLLHILELERISSDYYFLDENCSYNLLYLIEAARPTLKLTDRTPLLVLPTSTIDLAVEEGILEEAVYRPSQGTRIARMASLVDAEAQRAALELARAEREPASLKEGGRTEETRRVILDLAAEMLQLRLAQKELEQEKFNKLYLKLLAERSQLGPGEAAAYSVPPPPAPETGHRPGRAGAGGGVRRDDFFAELRVRGGYHALLDPDQGYLPGSQITYGDTSLRYFPATARLRLDSLHLLDILSLSPRDRFFKPYSWKVNTGWDLEPMADGRDSLIFRLNTGGGLAFRSPFGGIVHGFAEVDLNAGKRVRGTVALGPGASLGILEQLNDWWKLRLSVEGFRYLLGDDRFSLKGTLSQNFRFSRNSGVSLDLSYQDVEGHGIREGSLLFNRYF